MKKKTRIKEEVIIHLPESLDSNDVQRLLLLLPFIDWETGVLIAVENKDIIIFDDNQLINCLKFQCFDEGKTWLKKMTGLSILRPIDINMPTGEKIRQWYANPLYFNFIPITEDVYLKWHDILEGSEH